jgi:protoporphyrinogen oxidase
MARDIDVRRGAMVVGIDLRARRVRFDDGTQLRFGVLVSTMPLTNLVGLIDTPPEAVMDAARRLRATSVTYWDVGVVGSNRPGAAHWVYFPEPDIPFYRVGSASAAVSSLAPLGHRSYYVEVSHRHGLPCPVGDSHILAALRRVAFLREDEEPLVFARTTIDCAYVLMDEDYGDARHTILEWLASQHILSIGRYGGWMYDSMEGVIIQGREAAARARELL